MSSREKSVSRTCLKMGRIPESLREKRVLITGGLGMIGSTIAQKAVAAGARVTLVDACIEPYGANLFNIAGIRDRVTLNICDIRDREAMKIMVQDQDIIFNLAGQVSHNDSMENPRLDADINYSGHLNVLECLRLYNREAVVLHAGSRLQYGRIEKNPVDEAHQLRPRTPYAVNKTAAEGLYRFYHEIHGIRCVLMRITNPYGPRSQMRHSKYSMINWFIRLAMENRTITIYGDGNQVRDYIYGEDLAGAMIAAAGSEKCHGHVFNVGSGIGTSFLKMVRTVTAVVGQGSIEHVPWPRAYVNVETGDFVADIRRLSGAISWKPDHDLDSGVEKTFAFYKKYGQHYW